MKDTYLTKARKILITGGMGFIGTAVTKRFSRYDDVTVVDRLDFGNSPEVEKLIRQKKVKFIKTDLAYPSQVLEMIKDGEFEAIVHLAALTHIPLCEQYPDFAYTSNVIASLNVITNIPRNCKLIIFSSSSVYAPENKPHIEDESALQPIDFYGFTKKHVEDLSSYYAKKKKLTIINIRLANAAGCGETNPKLLGTILHQIYNGATIVELGDLTPKRDFIHIDDIAWVIDKLIEKWPIEPASAEFLNVGTGYEPISVKDLYNKIIDILGKDIPLRSVASRRRKINRELLYPDPKKLYKILPDYKPQKIDQWLPIVVKNPGLRLNNNIQAYIKKIYEKQRQ